MQEKRMIEEDACSAAPSPAPSGWEAMLADPPWAGRSFLAVSVATIGGLASWIGNYTSSTVAQLGGSYLGGYLIGWGFCRFFGNAAAKCWNAFRPLGGGKKTSTG